MPLKSTRMASARPLDPHHSLPRETPTAPCPNPGRTYTQAICSCGDWQMKNPGKGYVNESRRRHLASHPQPEATGPKALRDLLRLDL